jgi:hypothetical protein
MVPIDKAPGPDGFNGLFMKKCWDIIKVDFYKVCQDFFDCHCWRIKDVSTYDPQAYGPTPYSPRDSQGSCQSTEQGDYKRLIYLYSLTT